MKDLQTVSQTSQSIYRVSTPAHGMNLVPSLKPMRRARNCVLAQLPPEEYAALAKHLVPVSLPLGMAVSEPNQPIDFMYFLESGLISTDAMTSKGEQVEIGVIGREGF